MLKHSRSLRRGGGFRLNVALRLASDSDLLTERRLRYMLALRGLKHCLSAFSVSVSQCVSVCDPAPLLSDSDKVSELMNLHGGRVCRKIAISLLSTWNSVFTPRLLYFFSWSSDQPLALVRLSKITGKILLLKKVSVPGWHNHCRFPAPVVKQLCPKFCSTISRSF